MLTRREGTGTGPYMSCMLANGATRSKADPPPPPWSCLFFFVILEPLQSERRVDKLRVEEAAECHLRLVEQVGRRRPARARVALYDPPKKKKF